MEEYKIKEESGIKLLYVDLFCGAGGTSTGVEQATLHGQKCAHVIACVNHDPNAIKSHAANHPDTHHFTEDIRTRDRLATVQISCRDAVTVIEQRDSADTFFYLDPPYVGCQQQHYKGFTSEEFSILLTTLSMLKGKFIMSHFWNDQLREAVDKFRWNVVAIDSMMTVANNCRTTLRRKQELLVYNYDIIDLFHGI